MYKDAEKYRKVLANSTKEVYNISIRQKNSEICEVESMIKAGIIGATGYAGAELVRLLLGHKEVEIKWYGFQKLCGSGICSPSIRICFSW